MKKFKRYRWLILLLIFIITLIFFFSRSVITGTKDTSIKENIRSFEDAKLPVLYIQTQDQKVNRLHGYIGTIFSNMIRDTITPLEGENHVVVDIEEYQNNVRKLTYEIKTVEDERRIDSGTISALDKVDTHKTARIRIKANLVEGREYSLKIVAITDSGEKINYYTRIKPLNSGRVSEKLDFVMRFHESILDKDLAQDIINYLESNSSMQNNTLSKVNINSSFSLITFADMQPIILGEVIPTIKEINNSTASIELKYMLAADDNKNEIYYVKEFYRVRWTESRMYLLNYERKMEAVFNSNLMGLGRGELKLGITQDTKIELVQSEDNKKLCFVRERQLWFYDYETNTCTKVFSFLKDQSDYVRDSYDMHNIKILDMDEYGNINFIVYGYMNRDKYEGKIGICLYRYNKDKGQITELAFIPYKQSYDFMKEDVESLFYFDGETQIYLKMGETIYFYNLSTKESKEIGTNQTTNSFIVSEDNNSIILQTTDQLIDSTKLTYLKFKTGETIDILAGEGERIKPVGFIGTDFVYGLAKKNEVATSKEGNLLFPMYKLIIMDEENQIMKTYEKDGIYIMDTVIEENQIHLKRATVEVNGSENIFKTTEDDFIATKPFVSDAGIVPAMRYSETKLNELYISFPINIVISSLPEKLEGKLLTIRENDPVKIDETISGKPRYYVYSYGEMYTSYEDPAQAIIAADLAVGVVVNQNNRLIWERGGRNTKASISGISMVNTTDTVNSITACIKMILSYENINVNLETLSNLKESIKITLDRYLSNKALVLKGCSVEEIMYFVSQNIPVMAQLDVNTWVLIVGYDEYNNLTIMNPITGSTYKMGINDSKTAFEKMGNAFVSYID